MNGQSMTYDELNHYANRIANELMKNGVTYGERVALLVDRSFEMIEYDCIMEDRCVVCSN